MKQTSVYKCVAITAIVAMITACTPKAGGNSELKGTSWSGVHIAGDSIPSGIEVTLTFGTDGRLTGSAGCNRYFADYEQNVSSLKLGSIGATKKMCPELNMVAEQRYLAALRQANGWGMKDGLLYLFGTGAELTYATSD